MQPFIVRSYLQNQWITLHLWALDSMMLHPKWSLCWLPLPRVNQYSLGCATLSAAYVFYLFLQNHRALLYLWVLSLKCSLLLLGLVTESLDHTRLIGAYKFSLRFLALRTELLRNTKLMGF